MAYEAFVQRSETNMQLRRHAIRGLGQDRYVFDPRKKGRVVGNVGRDFKKGLSSDRQRSKDAVGDHGGPLKPRLLKGSSISALINDLPWINP